MIEAVQPQEQSWRNPTNGHPLFVRLWIPPQPRARMVVVHGFGEHGGRYEPLAQTLTQHGLSVVCADLWGHGRSGGARGDVERFEEYLGDLEFVIKHSLSSSRESLSYAVLGHSFGGLLATHWTLRQPAGLRSLLLQSPLFEVGFPLPRWKEALVSHGSRWCPRVRVPLGLNPAWLSHDPQVVRRYQEDPLVHDRMSLRCAAALRAAMRQALEEAKQLRVPTLLLSGVEDRVVSVATCQQFYERLTCEKRLARFPGCYHELHHEAVRPIVIEEMVQWIQNHV